MALTVRDRRSPATAVSPLRALARVNVAAIERNVGAPAPRAARRAAELCAVVKADGYGHGALPAARAALAGGATWLAVATADEAAQLRGARRRRRRCSSSAR